MYLNQAEEGKEYIVRNINLPFETQRRLLVLGMTDRSPVFVVSKKGKGILIVKLRGTRFAFGYNISKNIEVEDANANRQ